MQLYSLCGLTIRSEWRLSRLAECAPASCDLEIVRVADRAVFGSAFIGNIPGILSFELTESVVRVVPEADTPDEVVAAMILGPIMALMVWQIGHLPLHAGGVIHESARAFLFAGQSGAGKSTVVAAAMSPGRLTVGDDLVSVDIRSGAPIVIPSYPEARLWPDVADELQVWSDGWRLAPTVDKRAYSTEHRFATHPALLGGVFIVGNDGPVAIESLRPADAMAGLFGCTFERHLIAADRRASIRLFDLVASVVDAVPIWRLTKPQGLEALPDVVRLIDGAMAQTAAR